MARTYAGILGSLAFCVVVVRGLLDRDSLEATLKVAAAAMFVMAALGYVIGRIAATTIVQSVQASLSAQLDSQEESRRSQPA